MNRFRHMQRRIVKELRVKLLPRHRDRIVQLIWEEIPMTFDRPRFGVLESALTERARGGWQLSISKNLQNISSHFLDWVLWREALLSLLLPHIRHIPEASDLGLYAGLVFGDFTDSQRDELKTLWRQVSSPKHHQHYIYDAPFGFPLFNSVVDGTFIRRVIPWLNSLRIIHRTPLASTTYTTALERWMLETHNILTPTEHRILTALTQLTSLHQSRLAKQLNLTPSALSQVLSKLAQKHLLRFYNFINLPLIGLIPEDIFIHVPNSKTGYRLTTLFSEMQYVWYIHPIQQRILACRVSIPHNRVNDFDNWLQKLSEKETSASFTSVRSSDLVTNWNFETYQPDNGWPNDFSSILNQFQSHMNDEIDDRLSKIRISSYSYETLKNDQKFPIRLREEDFTYFQRAIDVIQITDRVSPKPSQEVREAGLSETAHMRYRRRIQKLEKWNISHTHGLWLYHLGLNTVFTILLYEPRESTEQFYKALHLFPNIQGTILDNGNGYFFIHVPNHSAVDFLSMLRKTLGQNEINAIIDVKPAWQSLTGFESPINRYNYNFDQGEWNWNEDSLPKVTK